MARSMGHIGQEKVLHRRLGTRDFLRPDTESEAILSGELYK